MSEDAILNCNADSYARRTRVEPGESTVHNADGSTSKLVRKNHTVGRGENLRDIAKKYGVSATDIKRWNKMRSGIVRAGQKLVIEVLEKDGGDAPQLAANTEMESDTALVAQDASAEGVADNPAFVSQAVKPKPQIPASAEPAKVPAKPVSSAKSSSSSTAKQKTAQPAVATTYKVKSGDTLDRIARQYGTTVAALRQANGMGPNHSRINIGQVLNIPAKTAAPAAKSSTSSKKRRR